MEKPEISKTNEVNGNATAFGPKQTWIGGDMKIWILCGATLMFTGLAIAGSKPVAYNNLSPGGRTALDQMAHDALDGQYNIIDFELAKHHYTSPRPVAGAMPHAPENADGKQLHGYVMLAYVVTTDGRAASPTIVKCTAPKLCDLAINATRDWRFEAATLDGKEVSTIALQEFNF